MTISLFTETFAMANLSDRPCSRSFLYMLLRSSKDASSRLSMIMGAESFLVYLNPFGCLQIGANLTVVSTFFILASFDFGLVSFFGFVLRNSYILRMNFLMFFLSSFLTSVTLSAIILYVRVSRSGLLFIML